MPGLCEFTFKSGVPTKDFIKSGESPSTNPSTLILKSGQIINSASSQISSFNGYLADENYFAGCGGGGSSSLASFSIGCLSKSVLSSLI